MELNFYKYQGTGNDFVIIDQFRQEKFDLSSTEINHICDRRFGIGADGLILIRPHEEYDFEMVYYNSDGRVSSMCGNGGRCIVMYAYSKKYISEACTFMAIDGLHRAKVDSKTVSLEMSHISAITDLTNAYTVDTGSPHYVFISNEKLEQQPFKEMAKSIRYSPQFEKEGININGFEVIDKQCIKGITYERGVEDITLSCGTGVTAMALVYSKIENLEGDITIQVKNLGGDLTVQLNRKADSISNVWLIGPATLVFEGTIELSK